MALNILLGVLALGTVWLSWRLLRNYMTKSPLDNIPGPAPTSWHTGNLGQLFDRHNGWAFVREISEVYGPVSQINGLLGERILHVFDPKAMPQYSRQGSGELRPPRLALNVDGPQHDTESHVLNFIILGSHHRRQRKMLNPVFSASHLRHMVPVFYGITHKLRDAIASKIRSGSEEIDVLNWMGRTALELIGQSGLGYSFDSLVADVPNVHGEAVKSFIPATHKLVILQRLFPNVTSYGSPGFRRAVIDVIPFQPLQRLKHIVDTMHAKSIEIFTAKKTALDKGDEALVLQVGEGKDIMSILLKANMSASAEDRLPEDELIAQMSSLIFAAMDTTSNALSRILHTLAQHPDVQDRLRKEILDARDGKDLEYDDLVDLPYMDAVCRETLRLFPPASLTFREAKKDTMLPLSEPVHGRDGSMIHEIPISKGTSIFIGVTGSNSSKALWGEDAYEWKPDRWLSPLPRALEEARIPGVYSNLMTFFGGGRSCIGFKFSQLEMKVVLSILMANFTFELADKPIQWNLAGVSYPTAGKESNKPELPMKVNPSSVFTPDSVRCGVWLVRTCDISKPGLSAERKHSLSECVMDTLAAVSTHSREISIGQCTRTSVSILVNR
ncbi:Docosahexaenoic acid omega-hydroxylase CYP4F3 [Grifola frondosa]|uniref:Docosahexaenoic acid omega-hydroxylase CYP4F3 n=1 Tax=Grifola frondosa TaxID=5627 RepID=A0A1C7LT03_GRIFR|nr:Docosahexaenoic acid omega-hydroxylase CYP4F3 [Grifola frondosa]